MPSLKSIEKKAKEYYFRQWRGNEKICPAFGEKVYITNLGWNHKKVSQGDIPKEEIKEE